MEKLAPSLQPCQMSAIRRRSMRDRQMRALTPLRSFGFAPRQNARPGKRNSCAARRDLSPDHLARRHLGGVLLACKLLRKFPSLGTVLSRMKLASSTQLSDEQIARFKEQGFLTLPSVSPVDEVAALRRVFERLFQNRAGRAEGAQFDMVGHDEDDAAPKLAQILKPTSFAPELLRTQARANALAIARQLLGPSATEIADHAILKPAGYGAATPWHQDEAFRDSRYAYEQMSIWIPLQEASPENGCMQYVPGTHRAPVLDHHSPQDDPRVHALECVGGFDPATAVLCPLPPGGAAIHHGRTLHYAGPNQSEVSRYAYVMIFEKPPVPLAHGNDFHWNQGKQTARLARRRHWWRRGGAMVTAWRKMRQGTLRHPRQLIAELRRLTRAVGARLRTR